ncbi:MULTISPECIES: iron-containing alcohol dehydrogenase family protein [Gibbsiella]|uniref:Iron-containing alcohol dehydrogenase family protein n=1 Tax=Gibbsiella dentisursi TaxID=796890 RepID=A0ABP7L2W1_9GAMM|nr:iron-containing alcohol dehydrogenase family protein [Gibbsiella quercinecans]
MSVTQIAFPARIVRGAGALEEIGTLCADYGSRAMLIGGERALAVTEATIGNCLRAAAVELVASEHFGGECTEQNINRLAAQARAEKAQVLIIAGGGKAQDTGKAVGNLCALPVITVPTIAATCAAVTPLTVRYYPDGHFRDMLHLANSPVAVVIDSQLLAQAPTRWLAAGLGDTLAKWYEYRAISRNGAVGGMALAAQANSRICYQLIETYGAAASQAAERGETTPELEQVLDAIFLFAGLTSLMGSGAHAAAAHALFEGFTVCDKTRDFGHGLLVGYGNLCLLAIEQRSDEELLEALKLAQACNIPLHMAQIADDLTADEIDAIVAAAVDAPDMANMPQPVTSVQVAQAIQRVHALAQRL